MKKEIIWVVKDLQDHPAWMPPEETIRHSRCPQGSRRRWRPPARCLPNVDHMECESAGLCPMWVLQRAMIGAAHEALSALETLTGFPLPVPPLVSCQVGALREALATLGTFIGPLPSVGAPV